MCAIKDSGDSEYYVSSKRQEITNYNFVPQIYFDIRENRGYENA